GSPTRPRRSSARVSAVAGRFRRSRRRAPLPVSEATAMDPSRRAAPRAAPPSPMSSSLSELVARLERALEAAAPVRVAGLRGSGPALCLARLLPRRPRAELAAAVTYVVAGETVTPDALVARLVEWGYHRVPLVQDPGDLALRGGILDVFPVGYGEPARLEFMGDAIESMRAFDPTSQRS